MSWIIKRTEMVFIAAVLPLLASACSSSDSEYEDRPGALDSGDGSSGLITSDDEEGARIGVNGYLWCASLDTLSFMPLQSVDPFGGVIITDWHAAPEAPNERFKMTVYILDRRLRADGVSVSVFRQVRSGTSQWQDAPVNPDTPVRLENAILTRARQLRIDTIKE
jgi:hypothetical protein